MKKIALLIMMFIFLTCKTACGQADSLQDHSIAGADRDDFIKVSMLVASPQRALYSVFGHAVLRLQSPSNNLDYVFTFESQPNMGTFITGVLGKARAHYVAVPAEQYIDDMRKDNRELWQYKLNLKPQEKQELWRILDSELQSGDYRYFNILYTNCLTTSVVNLQRSLMNEHVEWGEPIFPMMLSNGEVLRYTLRNSKWTEFLFVTFGGLAYGRHTPNESRLIPEVIIPMLRQAKIVENETGKSRPVITDKGKRLVKGIKDRPLAVSPMMVFGLLLLIALMVTACEWLLGWQKLARIFDVLQFGTQTLVGLLMLLVTTCSELFSSIWNWYYVVFLPVPLLLWYMFGRKSSKKTPQRKHKAMRCWQAYSIVLVLFMAATPLLPMLDLPHQLITASLAVRSFSHYLRYRSKNKISIYV